MGGSGRKWGGSLSEGRGGSLRRLVAIAAVLLPLGVAVGVAGETGSGATVSSYSQVGGNYLQVVSSSASPATVNAGSAVTFRWRIRSKAGVQYTSLQATGPNNAFLSNCYGNGTRVSGTARLGGYEEICIVPTVVANGSWQTHIYAQDAVFQQLNQPGPTFTVVGGKTPPPPHIVSSSASPTHVIAGSPITFTWRVTSQTGVFYSYIYPMGPNHSYMMNCNGAGTLVSGGPLDGTYQQACVVPHLVVNGAWSTSIYAQDGSYQQVSQAGPSFYVTGGRSAKPPKVVSSSVSPTKVVRGATITFTWHLKSQAGVQYTYMGALGAKFVYLQCSSGHLVSGSSQDGIYQEPCTVPTTATPGTWYGYLSAQDAIGQSVFLAGPTFTVF